MGGILSRPKPAPIIQQAAPTEEDPEVREAARKQRLAAAKAKGSAGTLLTGGQGVTGDAPVQIKTLLGA